MRRSDERQEVIDLLKKTGYPMAPGEIAGVLDKQPTSTRTLLWKMKGAGEIKLFGSNYQLPSYKPAAPDQKPKASKKKKEQNVLAFPGTNLDGNADNPAEGNGLDAERSHVSTLQHPTVTDCENGLCNTGNAGTLSTQPLLSQELTAFPAEIVPGNAGNGHTQTRERWLASTDKSPVEGERVNYVITRVGSRDGYALWQIRMEPSAPKCT